MNEINFRLKLQCYWCITSCDIIDLIRYCRLQYDACINSSSQEIVEYIYSNQSTLLTEMQRQTYLDTLEKCFGSNFREASLGLRHVDKGVYFDQIKRWTANFPRHNFHFIKYSEFKENPFSEIGKLLRFLYRDIGIEKVYEIMDNVNRDILNKTRLVSPNSLSRNITINDNLKQSLEMFYSQYNKLLYINLGISM